MSTENQVFRPIHYLGSKLRILPFIQGVINDINPHNGVVCDLFSGSGVVAKYLSNTSPVIANDIQEYSRIINSALLLPSKCIDKEIYKGLAETKVYKELFKIFQPLILLEQEALQKLNNGKAYSISEIINYGSFLNYLEFGKNTISKDFKSALVNTSKYLKAFIKKNNSKGLITKYYGGVYFSYMQAIAIDSLLEIKNELLDNEKNVFHAAILGMASDMVNTIGKQFAQPLSPFDKNGIYKDSLTNKIVKDRSIDALSVFDSWIDKYNNQLKPKFKNKVIKKDYREVFDTNDNIEVIYADPPYTRYHYSRYYHVLETICLNDSPEVNVTRKNGEIMLSKGIYRKDRHQSPFGLKNEVDGAFHDLFKSASLLKSSVVLSYSPYNAKSNATPRVQTIENIENIARGYFNSVELISYGKFSHSKLNKSELHVGASDQAEILIVCKR